MRKARQPLDILELDCTRPHFDPFSLGACVMTTGAVSHANKDDAGYALLAGLCIEVDGQGIGDAESAFGDRIARCRRNHDRMIFPAIQHADGHAARGVAAYHLEVFAQLGHGPAIKRQHSLLRPQQKGINRRRANAAQVTRSTLRAYGPSLSRIRQSAHRV